MPCGSIAPVEDLPCCVRAGITVSFLLQSMDLVYPNAESLYVAHQILAGRFVRQQPPFRIHLVHHLRNVHFVKRKHIGANGLQGLSDLLLREDRALDPWRRAHEPDRLSAQRGGFARRRSPIQRVLQYAGYARVVFGANDNNTVDPSDRFAETPDGFRTVSVVQIFVI